MPGVGAVSCPLPFAVAGEQLAITVAGTSDRIERSGQRIISTLLREVATFFHHPAAVVAPAVAVAADLTTH